MIRLAETPETEKVVQMLYAAGSLLFAFALVSALIVIVANFLQYRAQMVAALRTLRLDGIHETRMSPRPSPSGLAVMPRPDRRPVRPAPHLAA